MSVFPSVARAGSVLLLILMLVSCAGLQPGVDVEQAVQEAKGLLAQGEREEAAAVYWNAAKGLQPPRQTDFRLRAVEILLTLETRERAKQYLAAIDAAPLQGKVLARRQLAEARLALLFEQPDAALAALPPPEGLSPLMQRRFLQTRARALASTGKALEAVSAYVALDARVTEPGAHRAIQQALWKTLNPVGDKQLRQWSRQTADRTLKGWLELAYINKTAPPTLDELNQRFDTWLLRYPLHPAAESMPGRIRTDWRALRLAPAQIAVLLPLTGEYAGVAKAALSGIMTGYYRDRAPVDHPGAGAAIRVYDVGDPSKNVHSVYTRAVAEGADLVIGPLRKEGVEALARAAQLPVPIISLNYTSGTIEPLPENLYQFGLLPEDEARQVAERATLEGLDYAIAFAPYGEWGDRLLRAFRTRFEKLGGAVVASQRYDTDVADYAEPIRDAFNLDVSEERHSELQGLLRRNLEFVPRRRQDADFIFLAATPDHARLLRPQFNFHYGLDLPVYATSHVFSGVVDVLADRDMNGIIYSEIPWMLPRENPLPQLHQQLDELFPQSNGQLPRLVALGLDAYRVIPYLKHLAARPYERFTGVTGILRVDQARRIHRQLNWAQFVDGEPQAFAAAPMPPGPSINALDRPADEYPAAIPAALPEKQ